MQSAARVKIVRMIWFHGRSSKVTGLACGWRPSASSLAITCSNGHESFDAIEQTPFGPVSSAPESTHLGTCQGSTQSSWGVPSIFLPLMSSSCGRVRGDGGDGHGIAIGCGIHHISSKRMCSITRRTSFHSLCRLFNTACWVSAGCSTLLCFIHL